MFPCQNRYSSPKLVLKKLVDVLTSGPWTIDSVPAFLSRHLRSGTLRLWRHENLAKKHENEIYSRPKTFEISTHLCRGALRQRVDGKKTAEAFPLFLAIYSAYVVVYAACCKVLLCHVAVVLYFGTVLSTHSGSTYQLRVYRVAFSENGKLYKHLCMRTEMNYIVSGGVLNSTHSLALCI